MWVRCRFDVALSLSLLLLGMWLIPIYGALGFAIANFTTFSIICAGLFHSLANVEQTNCWK
jgi:O-antigen/teichoic acid export membrane protein